MSYKAVLFQQKANQAIKYAYIKVKIIEHTNIKTLSKYRSNYLITKKDYEKLLFIMYCEHLNSLTVPLTLESFFSKDREILGSAKTKLLKQD